MAHLERWPINEPKKQSTLEMEAEGSLWIQTSVGHVVSLRPSYFRRQDPVSINQSIDQWKQWWKLSTAESIAWPQPSVQCRDSPWGNIPSLSSRREQLDLTPHLGPSVARRGGIMMWTAAGPLQSRHWWGQKPEPHLAEKPVQTLGYWELILLGFLCLGPVLLTLGLIFEQMLFNPKPSTQSGIWETSTDLHSCIYANCCTQQKSTRIKMNSSMVREDIFCSHRQQQSSLFLHCALQK